MTRRRRGRRPGAPDTGADESRQPRVGPDGRPDERNGRPSNAYTPPPSPLTRWQLHANGYRGSGPRRGKGPGGPQGRPEHRGGPPKERVQRFHADARPETRPNVERTAVPRQQVAGSSAGRSIDTFELFCAYHLGITPDGGYRIQNIHEVARRFGTNAGELRQILADRGMAADDIVHSGFDLPSAQVDIMVAPEGISRRELARPLYDEFRRAPKKTRDWAREMEEAQRQIDKTIGRDGRWSPTPRDPAGKQP